MNKLPVMLAKEYELGFTIKKDNSKYLNEILFPYYLKLPNAEE